MKHHLLRGRSRLAGASVSAVGPGALAQHACVETWTLTIPKLHADLLLCTLARLPKTATVALMPDELCWVGGAARRRN